MTTSAAGKDKGPPRKVFAPTPAKVAFLLVAIAGVLLGPTLFSTCRVFWQFDHLERNAREVIGPGELQNWATNLISRYPTNEETWLRVSDLGTNFPVKLLSLYHYPPAIVIDGPGIGAEAPHLAIFWGGGLIGHTGLEIGPTTFHGVKGTNYWAPGIYSFKGQ